MAQRRGRLERPPRRRRLRRGSPPAAPRSSRRSLAPLAWPCGAPPGSAWVRRPGSRCAWAGTGPQQQQQQLRRPQPRQEWEASRWLLGPRRCPPEEAFGSGTTLLAMLKRWWPLFEDQTEYTESAGLADDAASIMSKHREACSLSHV